RVSPPVRTRKPRMLLLERYPGLLSCTSGDGVAIADQAVAWTGAPWGAPVGSARPTAWATGGTGEPVPGARRPTDVPTAEPDGLPRTKVSQTRGPDGLPRTKVSQTRGPDAPYHQTMAVSTTALDGSVPLAVP